MRHISAGAEPAVITPLQGFSFRISSFAIDPGRWPGLSYRAPSGLPRDLGYDHWAYELERPMFPPQAAAFFP